MPPQPPPAEQRTLDATRDGANEPEPRASATAEPTRLGRYLVIERVGAGAMGVVYSAYDPELDRKVAVKLLLHGRDGDEARARLVREAQAMAQLNNANVVAVHDVGVHDDRVYVAMDFVEGETLRTWLDRERRGWREILAIFVQAARGLAAAHEAGIVHRDFKPDNVLVDKKGRALVTDFGLARASAEATTAQGGDTGRTSTTTRQGVLLGSPAYMSSEQFAGSAVDARTDQFALCVALWEGLFGQRPFAGQSIVELALAVGSGAVRAPPSRSRVPRWLRRVLLRGLAVDPNARWPSIDALLDELARGQSRARTRRILAVLGAATLVLAGAEGWRRTVLARKTEACERAGASIAELWPGDGGATRIAIHDALLASGASYAATTAEKVQPWLDDWAQGWQRTRAQTCISHDVESIWDDDLAMRAEECLQERRVDLEALLHELARRDADVVVAAVPGAASLPRVEPCADAAMLAHRPPLPADRREAIATIRDALARAGALAQTGKPADAVLVAEAALADAVALDWAPLRAHAHASLGNALERNGDYERSERELVDAFVEAGKAAAPEVASGAAITLIYVVGYQRARFDEGLLWGRFAEVELVRLGAAEDDVAEAQRLDVLGSLHHARGEQDAAKKLFQRSLAIWQTKVGPDHPNVAQVVNNLGLVHQDVGAYAEALALHERALAIDERALGDDHPRIAANLNNLANVHFAQGDYASARALYERALGIYEAALGPEHPELAQVLVNLANVRGNAGDYAEAEALHRRALAIMEKTRGRDHPDVAECLDNLAGLRQAMGAPDEAKALHERALAIREKAFGRDHPDVAQSLANLASLHVAAGEYAEAKALHVRALAIRERALGPSHFQVARSLSQLGAVQRMAGEPVAAKASLERSIAIFEREVAADHPLIAYSLHELGELALAEQSAADAIVLLERALAIREARDTNPRNLARTRFALARALWDGRGDRARARALAEQAADGFRTVGPAMREELDRVDRWLAAHVGD